MLEKKYNFPWMGYNNGWPKWWHLTNPHSLLFKFDVYGGGDGEITCNCFLDVVDISRSPHVLGGVDFL